MRVSDLRVMMTDGRLCVIEVKAEGWKKPINDREQGQNEYLTHIRNHGGIGFFAQSVEDVRTALVAHGYA